MTGVLSSLLIVGCLAMAPAATPSADPDAAVSIKLLRAKRLVQQLEYDQARELVLEVLADPRANDTERFSAAMLSGRIHVILERDVTARLHFRTALEIVPDADLPKNDPPKIRAFFEAVKAEYAADAKKPSVNNSDTGASTSTSQQPAGARGQPAEPDGDLNLTLIAGAAVAVVGLLVVGAAVSFALAGHFAVVQNVGMDVAVRNIFRPLVLAAIPAAVVGALGVFVGGVIATAGVLSE